MRKSSLSSHTSHYQQQNRPLLLAVLRCKYSEWRCPHRPHVALCKPAQCDF
jgi:hypothetical protein